LNRLLHQLARDGHLTFRKKWRDLIIQIFGHESLYDPENLATVGTCIVFDVDFYRLSKIQLKNLAYRKLFNPFKWIEFLITAPLELMPWGVQRFSGIAWLLKKDFEISKIKKVSLNVTLFIFYVIFPFLNLAVNMTTGIVRRFLAPVRYIIRPAIELAKTRPKTFLAILGITLAIAALLTVSVFTGGLPVFVIGGIALASSLGVKIAVISAATVAIWASLSKCVSTIREFWDGIKRARGKTNERNERQWDRVDDINQRKETTPEISRALHAVNPELAEIKPVTEQKLNYRFSLFFGVEAVCFPKKREAATEDKQISQPSDNGDQQKIKRPQGLCLSRIPRFIKNEKQISAAHNTLQPVEDNKVRRKCCS